MRFMHYIRPLVPGKETFCVTGNLWQNCSSLLTMALLLLSWPHFLFLLKEWVVFYEAFVSFKEYVFIKLTSLFIQMWENPRSGHNLGWRGHLSLSLHPFHSIYWIPESHGGWIRLFPTFLGTTMREEKGLSWWVSVFQSISTGIALLLSVLFFLSHMLHF